MAETNNDKILDSISKMTVMEVVDLISEMEEKFGVKAAAAAAPAAAPAAALEAAPATDPWIHGSIFFIMSHNLLL